MKVNRTMQLDVEKFEVGDVISFELSTGEQVEAMAVKQEEKGMLFVFNDCLQTEYCMNEEYTNKGGYASSRLKQVLNFQILLTMPRDIRNRLVEFEEGIFLRIPTEKEIFGENEYGEYESDDVEQWEPMKLRKNRIASQGLNGDYEWYWLQNAARGTAAVFAYVNSSGNAYANSASLSYGVRPAFLIS